MSITPERIELRIGLEDFIVLFTDRGIAKMVMQPRLEDTITSLNGMLRPEWHNLLGHC